MAWLAHCNSNDELCDELCRLGVVGAEIRNVFKLVDRGIFTPQSIKHEAYRDTPLLSGRIHISAPHMYATVIEALDLKEGGLSFLNIGSGSGYFQCLVAAKLGKGSVIHGVEYYPEVVELATRNCKLWLSEWNSSIINIEGGKGNLGDPLLEFLFIQGNCFDIDLSKNASYDRIYIGAACPDEWVADFRMLLSDNGIMVLPLQQRGKLVRIKRLSSTDFEEEDIVAVAFAPLQSIPIPPSASVTDHNMDTSSSNSSTTSTKSSTNMHHSAIQLPNQIWTPRRNHLFPYTFRAICRMIFMDTRRPTSICGIIPNMLWMEILSFAHRNWFVASSDDINSLQRKLALEKEKRIQTERSLQKSLMENKELLNQLKYYRLLCSRQRMELRLHKILAAATTTGSTNSSTNTNTNTSNHEEENNTHQTTDSDNDDNENFYFLNHLLDTNSDNNDDDNDDDDEGGEEVEEEEEVFTINNNMTHITANHHYHHENRNNEMMEIALNSNVV